MHSQNMVGKGERAGEAKPTCGWPRPGTSAACWLSGTGLGGEAGRETLRRRRGARGCARRKVHGVKTSATLLAREEEYQKGESRPDCHVRVIIVPMPCMRTFCDRDEPEPMVGLWALSHAWRGPHIFYSFPRDGRKFRLTLVAPAQDGEMS